MKKLWFLVLSLGVISFVVWGCAQEPTGNPEGSKAASPAKDTSAEGEKAAKEAEKPMEKPEAAEESKETPAKPEAGTEKTKGQEGEAKSGDQ